MLGKLQTYKLQPTKFYENGHYWGGGGKFLVYLGSYWSLGKTENVPKLVKNDYETISVKFSFMSKVWSPGTKNAQNVAFFAIIVHRLGKPPLSRELLVIPRVPRIRKRHSKENLILNQMVAVRLDQRYNFQRSRMLEKLFLSEIFYRK